MAIRSREFVGIAEGIKSHELSTKSKIESLKGTVSNLSSRRFGLNREISSLQAELAAAYEDTDEDGDPDYGLIDSIESQIDSAEDELSGVENELDDANSELSQSEMELAAVMEEKAQTLFEIQERARKTSQNIATVGGMYGAYMGVGNTLQNSMQTSLASLSQAASILDGSVDGSAGGGAKGGQGRTASGGGTSTQSDLSTSALSAFSGGGTDSYFSGGSSPSNFSTNHNSGTTPASTHNFGGSQSINPQKTINFNSGQSGSSSASMAFSDNDGDDSSETPAKTSNYQSSQTTPKADVCFAQIDRNTARRKVPADVANGLNLRNATYAGKGHVTIADRDVIPEANTTYIDSIGNRYRTDALGRTVIAEGYLQTEPATKRNNTAQKNTSGKLADDDSGHFLGHNSGGLDGAINLAAQNKNLNRGEYKSMEKRAEKAMANGNLVYRVVQPVYEDDSKRPAKYIIADTVMDKNGDPVYTSNYVFYNITKEEREKRYSAAADRNVQDTLRQTKRVVASDYDYELSVGALLSKFKKKTVEPSNMAPSKNYKSFDDQRNEFIQRLQSGVQTVPTEVKKTSSNNTDDDYMIRERVRQRDSGYIDRENQRSSDVQRDISSIRDKFAAFLRKESLTKSVETATKDNGIGHSQRTIDNYCKTALNGILSESKQAVRLTDSVEFQDDAKFALGLGGEHMAVGVNGYNNGEKSYVKVGGPHPQKTAIHEHNHQLSCNDVKDKFGYVTEYRRGISIDGRDRQVNEALTEYFTKKMMGSDYPANPDVGYKDNMLRMEKMEKGFGEQTLKEAYYQNKPELLKSRYESVMGKDTWAAFSKAFDESLTQYTPQEVKTIREHYQKYGTIPSTPTGEKRKRAIDYANSCVNRFIAKSKGI